MLLTTMKKRKMLTMAMVAMMMVVSPVYLKHFPWCLELIFHLHDLCPSKCGAQTSSMDIT